MFLLDLCVNWLVCLTPFSLLFREIALYWYFCQRIVDVVAVPQMWIRKVIDCLILLHLLSWHWTDRSQGFLQIDDDWSSKEREERQRDSPYGPKLHKAIWTLSCWLRFMTHQSDTCFFSFSSENTGSDHRIKWQMTDTSRRIPMPYRQNISCVCITIVRENGGCRGTSATWKHVNLRSCIMNCSCMFILCPSL